MANEWRFSVLQYLTTPMVAQTIPDIKKQAVTDSGSVGLSGTNPGAEYTATTIQAALYFKSDSIPGGVGATYTTKEDITLDTSEFGILTIPQGTTLTKDGSGQLAYTWNNLSMVIPTGSWSKTITGTVTFNEVGYGDIQVTKTKTTSEGSSPHQGVVFTVTDENLNQFNATTNASGIAQWTNLVIGNYTLTESIPVGYTSSINNASPPTLTVTDGGTTLYSVTNTIITHTITTTASPAEGGSATVNGVSSLTADYGTELTFSATPNPHYIFEGWYKDGSPAATPSTLFEDADYVASFTLEQHTVLVSPSPAEGGSATVNGTTSLTADYGTELTFSATPNPHYTFEGWYKDGVAVTPPATLEEDVSLIAEFALEQFTITVEVSPEGKGGATVNNVTELTADYGTELTFEANPIEGYAFSHWLKDGESIASLPETLTEDATYTAIFIQVDYGDPERALLIRWMNDETGKWTNWRQVSLGETGDYDIVKILKGMGAYRTRKYQIVSMLDYPLSITTLEEDARTGGEPKDE